MKKTIKLSQLQLRKLVAEALEEENEKFPGFFAEPGSKEDEHHDETDPGFFGDEKEEDNLTKLVGDRKAANSWRDARSYKESKRLVKTLVKEAFQRITQEELQAWKRGDYSIDEALPKGVGPLNLPRENELRRAHAETLFREVGDHIHSAIECVEAMLDDDHTGQLDEVQIREAKKLLVILNDIYVDNSL